MTGRPIPSTKDMCVRETVRSTRTDMCAVFDSFTDMEHHLQSQMDAPMQVREEYQTILTACVAMLSRGRDKEKYHIGSPTTIEHLGIPRLPMSNPGNRI